MRSKHNKANQIACPICLTVHPDLGAWEMCRKSHASGDRFECYICDKTYSRHSSLQRHLEDDHASNSTVKDRKMSLNERLHSDDISIGKFICHFCQVEFSNLPAKDGHESGCMMRKVETHECCFCHLTFLSKKTLLNHKSICALTTLGITLDLAVE